MDVQTIETTEKCLNFPKWFLPSSLLNVYSNILFLAENRKILHEQEAEKMLIHLLAHESTEVQTAAAQALGIMSENLLTKDSIREWGK